jgi:hypothetical protein
VADAAGRTRACVFFSEDDLLGQVRTAPPELFGPADGAEPFPAERLFPFHAPLEHGHLAHDTADVAERAGQLRFKPGSTIAAEGLLGLGKTKLHGSALQ